MQTVFKNTEDTMKKSIAALEKEYKAIRAGRANPAVLEKVAIDYYGTPTPINQVAAVNVPEARMLVIQPWDVSSLKLIEKAILASDIGITPQNDGKIIRLTFPPLTEERRKDIVKDIHKLSENAKVAVRNIRRDAIDKIKALKKSGDITEDDQKNADKKIQDMTDKYVKEIEVIADEKQAEIMEI